MAPDELIERMNIDFSRFQREAWAHSTDIAALRGRYAPGSVEWNKSKIRELENG